MPIRGDHSSRFVGYPEVGQKRGSGKRKDEVLGELSPAGSYDLPALVSSGHWPAIVGFRNSAFDRRTLRRRSLRRGPTFWFPAIRWLRGGGVRSRRRPRLWDLRAGRRMARCRPLEESGRK
jgi:hypothetical protein